MKMKPRLLVLVCLTVYGSLSYAGTLSTGSVTNQTTASATVTFDQDITITNTLTPVTGLKTGEVKSDVLVIATGHAGIDKVGVKARMALKVAEKPSDDSKNVYFETYASGHEGESDYKMTYTVIPADFDTNSSLDSSSV